MDPSIILGLPKVPYLSDIGYYLKLGLALLGLPHVSPTLSFTDICSLADSPVQHTCIDRNFDMGADWNDIGHYGII